MAFAEPGVRKFWLAVAVLAVIALAAAGVACGGDDDDSGNSDGSEEAGELVRLANLSAEDALGPGGGKFQDTGFAVYCRQNSGYEGSVFETIGFMPGGSQAKDEFCYNVSADRTKVGLSHRSASSGEGSCIILTVSGGSVGRSEAVALSSSGSCSP